MRRSETPKIELLGPVDHLVDVLRFVIGQGGDLPGRADQPAQGGRAFDDAGVVLDMDGRGGVVDELGDVACPTDLLELIASLHFVTERDKIGRLAAFVQVEDGLVDPAVLFAVEILGRQGSRQF